MTYKFLVSLFLLVLLVGTVSAATWDNWKYYDKETDTITIKNNFILKDLQKAKLVSNTYNCDTNCKAQKQLTLYQEGVLIEDLKFYRLFTDGTRKLSEPKQYDLKYYKDVGERVCDGKVILTQKNGTEIKECRLEFNGKNKAWKTYELGTVVKAGTYEVELTGIKKTHKIYDWIITIQGRDLTEWATWGNISLGDDAEVNLVSPADNITAVVDDPIYYNATANVTGGDTLDNMSLFTDQSGTWALNETIAISGGGVVAFDSTSNATLSGTGHLTQQATHTAGGSDRLASVSLSIRGTTVTNLAITYDGVSMTQRINETGSTAAQCYIFTLLNPSTTSNAEVNATWSGSADHSTLAVTTFTGAGGTGGTDTDGGSAQTTAIDLTTITSNDFGTDCFASAGGAGLPTVGADQTIRSVIAFGGFKSGSSTQDGADGGAMEWDNIASDVVSAAGLVITPTGSTYSAQNFSKTVVNETVWNVQACDSSGACGFATANRTVRIVPKINVFSPTNSTHSISTIYFNATNESSNVDKWIANYNGTNVTLSDINTTLEVEDGADFNLLLYANNTAGFFGLNDTIFFSVDTTAPQVTVDAPNNSFNFSFHKINTNLQVNWTVSDDHLDSCILEYNGANTTVTCADNTANINITDYDNKSLVFYANDTLGNYNSSSVDWDYRLFETIEEFNATVLEGQLTTFKLELLTNGSTITLANLSYNNTENFGTITDNGGDNFTITKTITAPSVSTDTNVSFFWIIDQNTFSYSYASQNQLVQDISIDDCTLNTNVLYNFTMVNEETQEFMVPGTENTTGEVELKLYSFSSTTLIDQLNSTYTKVNPFAICVNDTFGSAKYNAEVLVKYSADIFEKEFYNIQNQTIDSDSFTQNITLYDLNSSQSQIFQMIVKDASFLTIGNALIEVQRKYIANGTFNNVEIPKTDENGEAIAHLVVDDVIYNFIIKKFGVTIREFNNVIPVCQNPTLNTCVLNFNAFSSAIIVPDFAEGDDFNFTLDYNESSRTVKSVFVIPSGEATFISLNVTQADALGTSVCNDFVTSASGTLTCTVPSTFGNSTLTAKLYRGSDFQASGQVKLDQDPSDIFGTALVILALLVMITLLGAGISDNPIYTVIFLMVGVVILFALNLVANNGFIGGTATILFLVIAIIIVIINARRNR